MRDGQFLRKARRACRGLGIKLISGPSPNSNFLWTGSRLYTIRYGEGNITADRQFLAHEIGHWQVAAPSRRRYSSFGLGSRVRRSEEEEEYHALLLGMAWEIKWGANIQNVFYESGGDYHYAIKPIPTTFNHYGMSPASIHYISDEVRYRAEWICRWRALGEFLSYTVWLQNKGLLTTKGKPTHHSNPGQPWTRSRKRSFAKLATSYRKRARRASTRKSRKVRISAFAL